MSIQPVFAGLVVDENDNPVSVTFIGGEPTYVVDDAGFLRHIPSEQVDRQVLKFMQEQIQGHEDALTDQTAKMLGQDDPFSRAMIEQQIKGIPEQFETLLQTGLPEEARTYMGMMGFKVVINVHGDVLDVQQPGMIAPDDEE